MKPTPLSTTCPSCHEEYSMLLVVDVCHYYRVTELDKGHVEGTGTGETEIGEVRLFCSDCGEYFEVPDSQELTG